MTNKHLFRRLQIKVRPKGLHSFAFYILIFDFSLQPLTPDPWPLPPNVIAHKYLRAEKLLYICRELSTSVESSLQIKLFMQNKANFQKVKLSVNKVLTRDYEQLDTWSIRKTKPIQSQFKANSKPIKANSKPIKANKMPKQTQFKPKQTQFQRQRRKVGYWMCGWVNGPGKIVKGPSHGINRDLWFFFLTRAAEYIQLSGLH